MENSTETRKEMLSWHKPQIQKLTINVETQSKAPASNNEAVGEG